MTQIDTKDRSALITWSTGGTVHESYGNPPDLTRRTLSRILLLVSDRLSDLERRPVTVAIDDGIADLTTDPDRQALQAWSTNKTVQDPDQSSPKWPNQITRGLARILLWACRRLDADRVLIEGHENIVRNLSARVETLECGPPINTASLDHPEQVRNHEQRLQRLEENERISNDIVTSTAKASASNMKDGYCLGCGQLWTDDSTHRNCVRGMPKSAMPGYVADATTAALNAQADKVSEALKQAEHYKCQFDGAVAQRDAARSERDAAKEALDAARLMLTRACEVGSAK